MDLFCGLYRVTRGIGVGKDQNNAQTSLYEVETKSVHCDVLASVQWDFDCSAAT